MSQINNWTVIIGNNKCPFCYISEYDKEKYDIEVKQCMLLPNIFDRVCDYNKCPRK